MVTVIGNLIWIIGSGEKINMWTDNWMGATLLSLLDLPAALAPSLSGKVSSLIMNRQWDLLLVLLSFPLVTDCTFKIILPISPLQDRLFWFGLVAFF